LTGVPTPAAAFHPRPQGFPSKGALGFSCLSLSENCFGIERRNAEQILIGVSYDRVAVRTCEVWVAGDAFLDSDVENAEVDVAGPTKRALAHASESPNL
jgi:hypothetical protein